MHDHAALSGKAHVGNVGDCFGYALAKDHRRTAGRMIVTVDGIGDDDEPVPFRIEALARLEHEQRTVHALRDLPQLVHVRVVDESPCPRWPDEDVKRIARRQQRRDP